MIAMSRSSRFIRVEIVMNHETLDLAARTGAGIGFALYPPSMGYSETDDGS